MNKLLTASLLIAGLSNTTQAASIDEAFKNASTSGQLRFGYISLSLAIYLSHPMQQEARLQRAPLLVVNLSLKPPNGITFNSHLRLIFLKILIF
ncbi:MAG: hypothetical protein OQK95_11125 [Gammaproteobacteria bacterium]|nr:hypothetical protein [Gammaproteobacteria bacterium]